MRTDGQELRALVEIVGDESLGMRIHLALRALRQLDLAELQRACDAALAAKAQRAAPVVLRDGEQLATFGCPIKVLRDARYALQGTDLVHSWIITSERSQAGRQGHPRDAWGTD